MPPPADGWSTVKRREGVAASLLVPGRHDRLGHPAPELGDQLRHLGRHTDTVDDRLRAEDHGPASAAPSNHPPVAARPSRPPAAASDWAEPSRSECPDTGPVMPAAVARLATIARTLRTFQGLGAHHVTPADSAEQRPGADAGGLRPTVHGGDCRRPEVAHVPAPFVVCLRAAHSDRAGAVRLHLDVSRGERRELRHPQERIGPDQMMSAASRRGREAMIASILRAVTAALRQRGRGRSMTMTWNWRCSGCRMPWNRSTANGCGGRSRQSSAHTTTRSCQFRGR